MKMLLLGLLLVALAISAVGIYLALTPTATLLKGSGAADRPYQPNRLDHAFPAWRRFAGSVLLIAVVSAIVLIEWPGLS